MPGDPEFYEGKAIFIPPTPAKRWPVTWDVKDFQFCDDGGLDAALTILSRPGVPTVHVPTHQPPCLGTPEDEVFAAIDKAEERRRKQRERDARYRTGRAEKAAEKRAKEAKKWAAGQAARDREDRSALDRWIQERDRLAAYDFRYMADGVTPRKS